jgi:hypothetical protein
VAQALPKSFGVNAHTVQDLSLAPQLLDGEDIAVGHHALISGRAPAMSAFLPKDRDMVQHTVNIYFERLNFHRPVFLRHEFEQSLAQLYAGETQQYDPGFLCSVYLVLALGTLSELNHRACGLDREARSKSGTGSPSLSNVNIKIPMPPDWPEHEAFLQRALAIKPELRVSISSLQALILLHWYLYTEVFRFFHSRMPSWSSDYLIV